jgi:hypothetical protein
MFIIPPMGDKTRKVSKRNVHHTADEGQNLKITKEMSIIQTGIKENAC